MRKSYSWAACVLAGLFLATPSYAQIAEDLFDSNTLQVVRLDLDPADWQLLKQNYFASTYYKATFTWTFNGRDVSVANVGIRSRGSGSRSPVKPGLGVDFTRYDSNQSLLGLKSVVLRNNAQDASMMREAVSMAVLRRMGVRASRESFARLYVNGEYAGLYTVVENIDDEFLKRNMGEDDGYLYSVDRISAEDPPFLFEYKGADPATYIPLPLKPENHSRDPFPGPFISLIQTANEAEDDEFEAQMSQYIDFAPLLMQLAVENYLAEQDGIVGDYGTNNVFFYRFTGTNRFQFVPWDKSNAFWDINRSIWLHTDVNVLVRRMLAVPRLRRMYEDAILETAATSKWIIAELARVYAQIHSAALEDPKKQCYDPDFVMKNCSNEQFEDAAAFLGRFLELRNAVVIQQLSASFMAFELNSGGISVSSGSGSSVVAEGHANIQLNRSGSRPAGNAIYRFRQNGVLVSQTAAPLSKPLLSGLILMESGKAVTTSIAFTNPNAQTAAVSFHFVDENGAEYGSGVGFVTAGAQISNDLTQSPFNAPASFKGTFVFTASVPMAVNAIRTLVNGRSEKIIASLPVFDTVAPVPSSLIPEFASGGGWTTESILLNPTNNTIRGVVEFWGQGNAGAPGKKLELKAGSVTASQFPYTIPPYGVFRLQAQDPQEAFVGGSVKIAATGASPLAFVLLSLRNGGDTVSATAIPSIEPDASFRVYSEAGPDEETAIAIANPSDSAVTAALLLTGLSGESIARGGTITVPPNGQSSMFLRDVPGFSTLPADYQGVLTVYSLSSRSISVIGFLCHVNERGDFLATALQPVSEAAGQLQIQGVFPRIVSGGGYSTQVVLFSARTDLPLSGTIETHSSSGAVGGAGFGNAESSNNMTLASVSTPNAATGGLVSSNVLSQELSETAVAQGSTRLENPSPLTSYYGYYNDVLAAPPDFPKMVPSPGAIPSPTVKVEATKSEPDKNTYLVFRKAQAGADPRYNYGSHFLFQGHGAAAGGSYITRINLDADLEHRITLMATAGAAGDSLPSFSGSVWYPFSERLLFTAASNGSGVWQATASYPSIVENLSGTFGRAAYEGIQADSRGNLILVEDAGGANGMSNPHARRPNSFVYRLIPYDPTDLAKGGKLQALRVMSKSSPGAPIRFGSGSADGDILSQDNRDLHTYGLVFETVWVTLHDTATQGNTPFDANEAAKTALATPFKRTENGQFRPGTNFTEFFFTAAGDEDAQTEAGSAYGGFGAIFRLVMNGADSGSLRLFYRGDLAHAGFDSCVFWTGDQFVAVEDAGDRVHAFRNALDSAYLFELNADYSRGGQPLRILSEGRDPSATVDLALKAYPGFQNDGDNEIAGFHVSDGNPTVGGLVGVSLHPPLNVEWRAFFTQQHGDNTTWEIKRRQPGLTTALDLSLVSADRLRFYRQ